MFWCRVMYNLLFPITNHTYKLHFISILIIIIFSAIVIIEQKCELLSTPYFILQGLCALFFYHVGFLTHKYEVFKLNISRIKINILIILCLILTGLLVCNGEILQFCFLKFPLFPCSVINSIIITFLLYKAFNLIIVSHRFKLILVFLQFCGNKSLLILCVHCVQYVVILPIVKDSISKIMLNVNHITLYIYILINIIIQITFCILIAALLSKYNSRKK